MIKPIASLLANGFSRGMYQHTLFGFLQVRALIDTSSEQGEKWVGKPIPLGFCLVETCLRTPRTRNRGAHLDELTKSTR